jgi:hypothetical protein
VSAGDPLDTLLVNFAGRDAQIPPDMRALSLEVMTGDPTDEHPAHLVVTVAVTPGAVELLQALVRSVPTAYVELASALEDALRDAARRTHEDLTARADTLAQAQQAAGPSPERVPPTDPPPAASSSPPPLTALPGGRTSTPADGSDQGAAARRPRPPASAATTSTRPRPTVRRSPFAGPPLRERILAELADLPSGQTLRSAELQRRCRASQASTDKALRGLADESRVLRVGTKGRYGYRLPTAGEAPAPTTNATRASGTASSTPPPLPGRQPIGNGKTGKISARRSGDEGFTLGGRILGSLQLADLSPEGICSRLREPRADVEQALEELRVEDDVQRMPDGRFRAVL